MDKKEKKELLRTRALKMQSLQRHALKHQDARDTAYEAQAALLEVQHEEALQAEAAIDDQPWTARTQMIRNRLTGKQRDAKDKWNRFAGTAAAGGMGR